jgi:hypothetical protein
MPLVFRARDGSRELVEHPSRLIASAQIKQVATSPFTRYNPAPSQFCLFNFSRDLGCPQRLLMSHNRRLGAPDFEEDRMMFEETLYLRDDEADEFGDSGAYGDTLEEDYEEEEEEEESELPSVMEEEPETASEPEPAAPAPTGGGGGGAPKPAKKKAAKKAAKKAPKKAAKKAAKKKAAKKPAKKAKKTAKKKAAKKAKKSAKKKGGRRR